jgi:capsular polysaccharide biosynthesis protein
VAAGAWGRARALAGRVRRRLRGQPATVAPRPPVLDEDLLALALGLLGDRPAPRIAIVAEERPKPLVRALRRRLDEATVKVVPADASPSRRHVGVTLAGPFDLVLDLTGVAQGRKGRFQELFNQLTPGGHLVIAGAAADLPSPTDSSSETSADRSPLETLLAGAATRVGKQIPPNRKRIRIHEYDEQAVADALTAAVVHGEHLVLTNGAGPALAKLREEEGNRLIERRPELGHAIVDTVDGLRFTSRCDLRESASTRGPKQPTEYDAPPAYLRDYRDVIVAPGQIVADDRVLWPDTFRHNARKRLRNGHTIEVAPGYARLPFDTTDLPVLEGTYFHLDNEVRGHFGHLLTEQVSRLWAWPRAKELVPDLKVLVGTNRRPDLMSYELVIYGAAGIPAEDIVLIREPVRVERLLSAGPMLSNPEYVHPAIADTWQRMGDALVADAEDRPRPDRIFCSRRIKKRACNNTEEVEEIFRAAGFEVIFPEEYSLPEQVAMFRSASVLAGFAGSGLFNVCFAPEPTHLIMLSSDAYWARNEYLMSSVLGHRIDSITSVPDTPGVFQSSFTFDVDREGRYLAGVLAGLDDPGTSGAS